MVGRRRALVAVLATCFAVLAFGQPPSTGVVIEPAVPHATALAAADPTSAGRIDRASVATDGTAAPHGGSSSVISGNGRWEVFTSVDDLQPGNPSAAAGRQNVFVRDLRDGTTTQLTRGSTQGTPEPPNGDSSLPDITDDGRYVSFLTNATNIVAAAGGSPRTLVVCDRDPDGDHLFDEVAADGSITDVCVPIHSTPATDANAIVFDRPRLSGLGDEVVWTQGSLGVTHVWHARFLNGGVLTAPTAQQRFRVQPVIANPAGCGTQPSGAQTIESQPVITDNASEAIFTLEFPWGNFCSAIVGTTLGSQPTTTRYDLVPTGCGTGFLGDEGTLIGECAAGSGGSDHGVSSPSIDQFGSSVMFAFHDGPSQINFAAPHAAASPTLVVNWMVLTRYDPFQQNYSSQVISRDNSGTIVDSEAGAVSEDGRYIAFETSAPNSSDGADIPVDPQLPQSHQVVARDLVLDQQRANQGQPRLPGALVTFHDPSVPMVNGCTPAAGQLCGSAFGTVGNISFDDTGALISFTSTASDLIPGDGNNAVDAFVHTWQPTLSTVDTDFGDVQAGTHSLANLPVQVTGFGPVRLGATHIGGTDAGDFTAGPTTCDAVLFHTGDSCVVAVDAAPTPPLGTKTADVSVDSAQYDAPVRVATVTVNAVASVRPSAAADNTRTSVRNNGGQSPTGGEQSMISADGRWQIFASDSELTGRSQIDPGTVPPRNVFVRDLADPQHTLQISLHSGVAASPGQPSRPVAVPGHPRGATPDGDSFRPSISSDGRFVSFITDATDIVPSKFLDDAPTSGLTWTVVVCDRDPSGARDAAGNLVLDRLRPGTKVPDYACYPVESGNFFVAGRSADRRTTPRLAGNGTRITWVEDDGSTDARRAVVSTLSAPGKALHAPTDPALVPINGVAGFTGSATTSDFTDAVQSDPRLTSDGGAVVFGAQTPCCPQSPAAAVIRTTLSDGSSTRFDTLDGGGTFLGDGGGQFDAPAVSGDGGRVAFAYRGPSDPFSQVWVVTDAGGTLTAMLESRDNQGNPSAGAQPALSADGRYLGFQTSRPNESNAVDPPNGSCFANGTNANVNCQIVARDLVKDAARAAGDPWVPSEIVSSSISTSCPDPLPAGRKCGANDASFNPSIDNTGSEIGFDSVASDIVNGDDNIIDCEGACPATDAFVHTWRPTLSTPALDFGTVQLGGHADKTFDVTESGFGPVSLGATSITGTNAADFEVRSTTCPGTTLNDTEQCQLKLRFTPPATGDRTATLATAVGTNGYPRHNPDNTIAYDPALVRALTGTGTNAVLTADPAVVDFGTQLPEAQPGKTKTVTITNSGNAPVTIGAITPQDTTHPGAAGDYTVTFTDCLATITPGAGCTISITYVGHRVGVRDASLVITNDGSSGPLVVGLKAKVPKPQIIANPGVTPPGRVTIISGTGFAPNLDVTVALVGSAESVTATADAHGAFDVGLVIFRSTPLGPRTVKAQTDGKSPTISAKGPLLIALGSVDILDLVTRH